MTEFCDWFTARIAADDLPAFIEYRSRVPHTVQNHPTDEYLLPLFVALGAANNIDSARDLNRVMTYGLLAMDAWVFD